MSAFYAEDLAHIHDSGFGFLAREAAPRLVSLLREADFREGLVVDLGCGSGIAARMLLDAGYDVLGVDVSSDMLEIARRRAPEAELVCAPLIDAELPAACVGVCSIGEALGYAFDERAGRDAAAALFARAHQALVPGGVLMFDVAEPGREGPEPRRFWREGEDWVICIEASEQPSERLLTRRMVLFRRDGAGWRRSDEEHLVRLWEREEVLEDLRAAGFDVRLLDGYTDNGRFLSRGHAGFVAVKPVAAAA